ncbi:MAG TPA: GNAT family N-acetyltransferase [Nitrolancea sp.]|nr:GNAT family N-acetyltransferase [Nitrolancea sp.]
MSGTVRPRTLSGPRLHLVAFGPEFLDAVRHWRSDPEVTRYWINQDVPDQAAIRRWYEKNLDTGALVWAMLNQGEPIGYVTLFDLDEVNRKAELALMIGERSAWGRGFAKETLRIVLRHAFAPETDSGLGLNKVYLAVFAENIAARRAYRASGFREDGVLREDMYRAGAWHDQVLMSALAREFNESAATHATGGNP